MFESQKNIFSKNIYNNSLTDQLVMFILLFWSGSPIFGQFGKLTFLYALILTLLVLNGKVRHKRFFLSYLQKFLYAFIVLFIFQYFVLGFVSVLGAINLIVKFIIGALIIYYLDVRFPYVFFKLLSKLSLISLIGFFLFNVLKITLPGLNFPFITTVIVFAFNELHPSRNVGMFWEPGAFAGIITTCFALNLPNIHELWKRKKTDILTIVLALITTKSTTGYLVFFLF